MWAGLKFDVYARQFVRKSKSPCCVTSENVDGGTVVADPIVKKLFCSLRPFIFINSLMVEGIVPDKRLELRSKYIISVSNPKVLGIDPVSLLPLSANIVKFVIAPKELGIVPVKEFKSTVSTPSAVRAPILAGIVPVRRFL